jgi:hypothetical protein
MHAQGRQGGWAGLVALLIVVLVVAFLARGTLKQYGLLSGLGEKPPPHGQQDRSQEAGTGSVGRADAPAPRDAMERVRRLQDSVQEQATELGERIDRSTK